jgi:hypothetical protein
VPDYIDVPRHRDFEGRRLEDVLPRVILGLLFLIPLAALFNVFGQAPDRHSVSAPNGAATLDLSAPTDVRGGLLFEASFDIVAKREIKDAVLVLDSGWLESMTLNTAEPSPASETSRDGSLALDLGAIPAGTTWRQFLQFQANPVNLGSQSQGVTLYDGHEALLHLNRTITVWP